MVAAPELLKRAQCGARPWPNSPKIETWRRKSLGSRGFPVAGRHWSACLEVPAAVSRDIRSRHRRHFRVAVLRVVRNLRLRVGHGVVPGRGRPDRSAGLGLARLLGRPNHRQRRHDAGGTGRSGDSRGPGLFRRSSAGPGLPFGCAVQLGPDRKRTSDQHRRVQPPRSKPALALTPPCPEKDPAPGEDRV